MIVQALNHFARRTTCGGSSRTATAEMDGGTEPDWEQQLDVIRASRSRDAAGT